MFISIPTGSIKMESGILTTSPTNISIPTGSIKIFFVENYKRKFVVFQFQLVRLKYNYLPYSQKRKPISIPTGSIKIQGTRKDGLSILAFQFQLVRLKFSPGVPAKGNGNKFQFQLVRLK